MRAYRYVRDVYRFTAPRKPCFSDYLLGIGYDTTAMFLLSLYALLRPGFDVVHIHNTPDTLV